MQNKNCINMCALVSKALNTPYNWSIGLMSFVIWIFTSDSISYYNNSNFDMLVTLHGYIQWLSLGAVIIGLIKAEEQYLMLAKYGIITYLFSVLTLIFTRNVFFTVYLAYFVLKPASIFFFLMMIKQVWNLTCDSVIDSSISSNIVVPPALESQINLKDESIKLVEGTKTVKTATKKRKTTRKTKAKQKNS